MWGATTGDNWMYPGACARLSLQARITRVQSLSRLPTPYRRWSAGVRWRATVWARDARSRSSAVPTGLRCIHGHRRYSELRGRLDFGQHSVPQTVDFLSAVAGARHGCGLNEVGSAECWGADDAGQLESPDATFLALGSGPTSLHTCGVVDDGDPDIGPVLCWGLNAENQLTP